MRSEPADLARTSPSEADAPRLSELQQLRSEIEWLRAERARYRAVAELTPGLAFDLAVGPDGAPLLRWVNPALQRLLEVDAAQEDRVVCRYLYAEDEAKAQDSLETLRAGRRVEGELRVLTPSRGVRHLRFWAQPVRQGERIGRIYGAAEDITTQRYVEDELRGTRGQLRALMEGLPGTVSRVSRSLRYLDVNERLARLFGRRPEEFVGQTVNFLDAGRELHDHLQVFFDSDAEQDAWEFVSEVQGEERYLLIVAQKHDGGQAAHLIGLDLTEQRRAEQASRQKDGLYRALVETAPEAILVVDLDQGCVTDANANVEGLLGYDRNAIVGQPLDLICPPWQPDGRVSADRLGRLLQRAFTEPVAEEWNCRSADGLDRICELRLNHLCSAPRLIRCSLRDLTEQKYREQELVTAREQAEAMMQIRASFLSNMSHEFRTPLTGIIGFSTLLRDETEGETQEMVHVIERSGTRLLRLLNGILDLATLEAGSMEVRAADLDVGREVREAIRLHAATAAEKGLALELDLPDASPRAILDPTLFQRVLASLLDNAIRFTAEGRVTVRLCEAAGEIRVAVEDTGIGISRSFLPFVFEGFSQESTGIARTHEGSGLGLAITKHLVELMEGTVHVESEQGVGSTFTVAFPSFEAEQQAPAAPRAPLFAQEDEEAGASILAVEDSADAQRMLYYCLGAQHRLDAVATETEALRLAAAHPYDLVLMDVNLGAKRDGVDVLRALREMPGYETTPIIAVTAYAMPGDRERFLRCGFDGYVGKPFTTARVREVVHEQLAQRSAAQREEEPSSAVEA